MRKKISLSTKIKMSKAKLGKKNSMYGRKHTEESKKKMRVKRSEETKKKMSENHADFSGKNNPMYGKKHSKESIEKMSGKNNVWYGKHLPKEVRRKLSEAMKGRYVGEKNLIGKVELLVSGI